MTTEALVGFTIGVTPDGAIGVELGVTTGVRFGDTLGAVIGDIFGAVIGDIFGAAIEVEPELTIGLRFRDTFAAAIGVRKFNIFFDALFSLARSNGVLPPLFWDRCNSSTSPISRSNSIFFVRS